MHAGKKYEREMFMHVTGTRVTPLPHVGSNFNPGWQTGLQNILISPGVKWYTIRHSTRKIRRNNKKKKNEQIIPNWKTVGLPNTDLTLIKAITDYIKGKNGIGIKIKNSITASRTGLGIK